MKITCDLCNGTLQMNSGGKTATCTACGLVHPMDRLREKLTGNNGQKDPPKPPMPSDDFDYKPQQFTMSVTEVGADYVSGHIQQGGIGVGDSIYINHDYAHPYTVCCLNDPSLPDAKEGMWARRYLKKCPKRILKNATAVTGDQNPVANAYNYPGTVYEYFSHLLPGTFGAYEVRENMPKIGLNIPVSYLFSRNGKPVLAVFLIHSNDSKAHSQVRKAERIFAQEGVACTHFYENYRNDAPYVIDRVKGALG